MWKAALGGLALTVAFWASVAQADPSHARIVRRGDASSSPRVRVYANQPYPESMRHPDAFRQLPPGFIRPNAFSFERPVLPNSFIIERPIADPAAVVSSELARQPVWPHLIEVFIFSEGQRETSTIFLDPNQDYEHQGLLTLDENHFINRAQRLARSLRTPGSYIIVNPAAPRAVSVNTIKPRMIIEMPGSGGDAPEMKPPSVPRERVVSTQ